MAPEKVTFFSKRGGGEASGLLFGYPSAGSKGVVLLHEWWGLNDYVIETAQKIQDAGFVVLATDVFRGHVYTEPKQARENMMTMDYDAASHDVLATVRYLKALGCGKVAVIGFAFGASLSLAAAALHADSDVIDAVAPHCGVPRPNIADVSKIKCPVQGHYAAKDKVVGVSSPLDYNKMAEQIWNADGNLEMCIYDAEHAFTNPSYPTYHAEKTAEFYNNLFRFLNEKLAQDSTNK
jgi:carboxymethylenebutenolidase